MANEFDDEPDSSNGHADANANGDASAEADATDHDATDHDATDHDATDDGATVDEAIDDEATVDDAIDEDVTEPVNGNGSSNGQRIEAPSLERMTEARRAIEAVLLVATDPTPDQLLAQLVELPADLVHAMCMELADEYDEHDRGFQLRRVAGGWRYQTNPSVHPYVERYALEGVPNRLSGAALETLSIVAYKQPISRGQIGAIRGVNVDGVLRTLVQRGYVEEHGKDDGPGQASLFGTTTFFLERLGIDSLDQLPSLGDFVPSAEVLEALEETLKIESSDQPLPIEDEADDGAAVEAVTPDGASGAEAAVADGEEADGDEPPSEPDDGFEDEPGLDGDLD